MKKILLLLLLPILGFGQYTPVKEVIIHITTDTYPSETRWVLHVDSLNGLIIGDVNYGHYTAGNTAHTDTLYIADTITDITFVMYDSYGDGMNGSYYVSICADTIISYPNPSFSTGTYSNRTVPSCMPTGPPTGPCVPAILNINLDQYQSETTWEMHDSTGNLLFAGGPYTQAPDYQPQFENVCLPVGEVTLTMYDAYGDGLAGSLWGGNDGSYYIFQCGDTIVFGDVPNFGTDTSHAFISDTCAPLPPVPGCMDENYLEYDLSATQNDSSYCITLKVLGCIDTTMFNYDTLANYSDYTDSCLYTLVLNDLLGNGWVGSTLKIIQEDTLEFFLVSGFTDTQYVYLQSPAPVKVIFEIVAQASATSTECGFSLIGPLGDVIVNKPIGYIIPFTCYSGYTNCGNSCEPIIVGCMDYLAHNYVPEANIDTICYYSPGCTFPAYLTYYTQGFVADIDNGSCDTIAVFACMDSTAFNYDSTANVNTGCQSVILGCMQPLAFNYEPLANTPDTCEAVVSGCMSSIALNYNSNANTDDGSCIAIVLGCTNSSAFNYNPFANVNNGSCIAVIYGCINPTQFNYDPLANTNDGSCIPVIVGCTDSTAFNYSSAANTNFGCIPFVYGCTDPVALNYNASANTDDFTCVTIINGCTDSTSFNYNPLANTDNGTCIPFIYGCTDPSALNYDLLANTDDFSCIMPILGCTDSLAFNYNPVANVDFGCIAVVLGCTDPTALNYCDSCNTDDFSCILPIYGCTDSTMFNFNPLANVDNNTCTPITYGCTDPSALNYNSSANTEDFSCISYMYGCTDSSALNFDSLANTDNGSCVAVVEGCMDPTAYNYSGLVNSSDSSSCLYSANCITGDSIPYWLNDPCYAWVIDVDDYCCENEWDEVCQLTYQHCFDGYETVNFKIIPRNEKNLLRITDILGRRVKETRNTVLFYIFDDGTVERKIIKK